MIFDVKLNYIFLFFVRFLGNISSAHHPVLNITENYIDISSETTLNISCAGRYPLLWEIKTGKKEVNDSRLEIIHSSNSEQVNNYTTVLSLHNVTYKDTGFYSCYYEGIANHSSENNATSLYVFVNDPLHLFVENPAILSEYGNETEVSSQWLKYVKISCLPTNSKINVSLWETKEEQVYQLIELKNNGTFDPMTGFLLYNQLFYFSNLQCRAYLDNVYDEINVTHHHTDSPYVKIYISNMQQIVDKDNINLACRTNNTEFTQIEWKWRPKHAVNELKSLHNISDVKVIEGNWSKTIEFHPINLNMSGHYECTVSNGKVTVVKSIKIDVEQIQNPKILENNMFGTNFTAVDRSFQEFFCNVEGNPFPSVTWWKDGELINSSNIQRFEILHKGQKLRLLDVLQGDSGNYSCVAENRGGQVSASQALNVLPWKCLDVHEECLMTGQIATFLIIGIIVFSVMMIVIASYLIPFINEKRMKKVKPKNKSEYGRENSKVSNSSLNLRNQIELLPHKDKWEFPRNRLKFEKCLCRGTFGPIIKAKADRIIDGEESTNVAVKMLEKTAVHEAKRMFVAELGILIKIGKHLNIVNFLGAVTENVAQGELYIILEYCCHGNLKDFLLHHREAFIDQLDHQTGQLNTEITLSRHPSFNKTDEILTKSNVESEVSSPTKEKETVQYLEILPPEGTNNASTKASVNTSPSICLMDDCSINNLSSVFSAGKENECCGKESKVIRHITTSDLLCFVYQCARGMEYLASQKLIHKNLTTRSVLLTEDNTVKICGVGLTSGNHTYSCYTLEPNELQPIKWMAIETISDSLFTTESDVWSFGILLWEAFTLGSDPYPGINTDEEFLENLKHGYRMEKPCLAPNKIYELMKNCWLEDSNQRPHFSNLVESIGSLLEPSVRMDYVELDKRYQGMNEEQSPELTIFQNEEYV